MMMIPRRSTHTRRAPIEFVDVSALAKKATEQQQHNHHHHHLHNQLRNDWQGRLRYRMPTETMIERKRSSVFVTPNNIQVRGPSELRDLHICLDCNVGFMNFEELRRHVMYECPEILKRYQCAVCKRTFRTRTEAKLLTRAQLLRLTIFLIFAGDHHPHVDLAEWFIKQEEEYGIPQSFFQVVTTDYEESTLNKEHRKRTTKNNTTVICEECGKSFSRLDSLRRHEKLYCRVKGERVFCRFCGKKFVRALSLVAHIQSVHAAKLPQSDPLGENTKGNVTDENHHDEDSEICEVPFHGQLTMNYLLCDSSILNPVEPSVVQSRNSSSSGSSKPCQQFRCDGCGRTYTRVDSLKRHQQKCDDLLASLQDRQENLERLQQQEYSCNQCGKSYRRLDTLRRHQRLVCADKDSVHSVINKTDKTGSS
ncbi:hypothetical protein HZH66_011164 [Vespula vulgaris]|uniref:C2H2-type domain-containing protein n=1 Tax=Vespula vulgaris TaxID=7454 RepID=A0A834JGH6_VESVU|nr:hypothetical protein HZH66_011164 [Vespula vulgaris]